MTYQQLAEMFNSLDEELDGIYQENLIIHETNELLKEENVELQLTVDTLIKTLSKGKIS